MRIIIFGLFISLLLSCGSEQPSGNEATPVVLPSYPEAVQKVMDHHGGIDLWRSMKTMQYDMPKGELKETHIIDLQNRYDRIEGPNFVMGYDGNDVWLEADTSYKGNAIFYHNLMFYFYAMPFVLVDDGIIYTETEPLQFEGKSYPGIQISYEANVGWSAEDEYVLYYDPETFQMAWLGYTVTYYSKEKSKEFRFIRYDDWEKNNGLLLPNSMSWYNYEGREIKDRRSTRNFENIALSQNAKDPSFYARTPGSEIVVDK